MKAVAYYQSLPSSDPQSLQDIELPAPTPGPRDLLVQVRAISVNPVDTKIRSNVAPTDGQAKVLGWDVAGVVQAVGSEVSLFQVGDEVFYAGALQRQGGNSELHLVDERIVGHKPRSLGFAEAAALPLTAITAWEMLFHRLGLPRDASDRKGGEGRSLLIVGGAGGVGSIAIQLARQLTNMEVIATASRPESREWCLAMGAHQVVSHHQLQAELTALGVTQLDAIFCTNATEQHWDAMASLIRPFGHICTIAESSEPWDLGLLKSKSVTFSQEFMFTRSLFQTPDMIEQHNLLNRVAELIDAGTLKTTLGEHFGVINAANLRRAHALLESGKAKGKIVLEGF